MSTSRSKRHHSKPNSLFTAIKQLAQSSRIEPSYTQPLQSYLATPQPHKDNYFLPPSGHSRQRSRYQPNPGELSAPVFSQMKSRYQPSQFAGMGGSMGLSMGMSAGMSMGLPTSKRYFSSGQKQRSKLEESALSKFKEATSKKSSGHSLVVNETI